jgi:hypothetical protein
MNSSHKLIAYKVHPDGHDQIGATLQSLRDFTGCSKSDYPGDYINIEIP